MKALRALQESVNTRASSHRGSFYRNGLSPLHSSPKSVMLLKESMEKQGMMKPKKSPLRASSKAVYLTKEKKMVEMEPMMIHNSLDRSDRKGRMFYRFMAVPPS